MQKQGDVVVYFEAGVEANALVLSSNQLLPDKTEVLSLALIPANTQGLANLTAIGHGLFLRVVYGVRPRKDNSAPGWKPFASTPDATVRALKDTVAQLDSQLSACGAAATNKPIPLGVGGEIAMGSGPEIPTTHVAVKSGSYYYSNAYQSVLELRGKYEDLLKRHYEGATGGKFDPELGSGSIGLGTTPVPSAEVTVPEKAAPATPEPPAITEVAAPEPAHAPLNVHACTCATPMPVSALHGEACGLCGGELPAKAEEPESGEAHPV